MHFVVIGAKARARRAARGLTGTGHVVQHVDNVDKGVYIANLLECDAVVVGPSPSADEGLTSVARIRKSLGAIPIVALIDAADAPATCALLESGADDVVVAGAGIDTLIAALIVQVRRANGHTTSELKIGALRLELGTRRCAVAGQPVDFTPTEYRLLEALALRKNRLVKRTSLLELLYGGQREPFARAIDLFVHNIRAKLRGVRAGEVLETRDKAYMLRDDAPLAAA